MDMTRNGDKVRLLLGCILVSILVALTYFAFEAAVRNSITYIWNTVFDTQTLRYEVVPLSVIGALIFFGLQHRLDPASENHEKHGLGGEAITPTLRNLAIILGLGFVSLVGGASLGPEAVLVPACMLIGGYVGLRFFKGHDLAAKALAGAGLMALMTAFFHSFIIGILSVFLVTGQTKSKLSPQLAVIAVLSSVTSFITLNIIDPTNRYFNFPPFNWKLALLDLTVGLVLVVAGYIATFALKEAHSGFVRFRSQARVSSWWWLAVLAGLGLSLLYLLGGPLVEFTGNQSISPLLDQAPSLGIAGVLIILVIKLLVIGWSKAMGYRGGLIFPMIFVASALAVLLQLCFHHLNFGIGLIAAMIGILLAERKAKILL
jgi:H+/Cl- antiporter ClcA